MKIIDLKGSWKLCQADKTESINIDIPGDNLSALYKNGLVENPVWGKNELDLQWIGQADWIFTKKLMLDANFLEHEMIFLNAESLDTFAEIYINGHTIAKTENMFIRTRIELKEYLKTGENEIKIYISSPEKKAAEKASELKYEVPHDVFPVQSMHRNLVRKVQSHAGWDWGPCLMVSGIYNEIFLAASHHGRIEYLHTDISQTNKNDWLAKVNLEYKSAVRKKSTLKLELAGQTIKLDVQLEPGKNMFGKELAISNPKLWCPTGYGAQNLYELKVSIEDEEQTKKIGFRKVEIKNNEDDHGKSFTICVNNIEIFCKGANWIPINALPGKQTNEQIEKSLLAARAANMNMLRIWGGGQYENGFFYELCDRLGILLWHDFMFSCSLYPTDEKFLGNVRNEIKHQVKRLKDHPSIALWCGNNENLGAITWYKISRENPSRYYIDYDRLNNGVIAKTVKELDQERPWWPSSPCAGEDDYSDAFHNPTRGDMHYWSVWHEGKPFEAYYDVTPRFCSEFGFQSFPSIETIKLFAEEKDLNISSPVFEHHQRNKRGNSIIVETIINYFRYPHDFNNLLYISQLQQALAIKTAVEFWRSKRPLCMGALYWQLNDLWPAVSWSSLEYTGKWKILHYLAREFYQPVHILAYSTDNQKIEVCYVNDTLKQISAVAEISYYNLSGDLVFCDKLELDLKPENAGLLKGYTTKNFISKNHFFILKLNYNNQTVTNFFLPEKPKSYELKKSKIKYKLLNSSGNKFTIEVTTKETAFFVYLDAQNLSGTFDQNCFILPVNESEKIIFIAEQQCSEREFINSLQIYDLRSSY
jgi:beta-mannosidase